MQSYSHTFSTTEPPMWMDKGREVWPDSAHYLLLMPTGVHTTELPRLQREEPPCADPSLEVLLYRLEGGTTLAECMRAEGEVTNLSRPINKNLGLSLSPHKKCSASPLQQELALFWWERVRSNSESQTMFVGSRTVSEHYPWALH